MLAHWLQCCEQATKRILRGSAAAVSMASCRQPYKQYTRKHMADVAKHAGYSHLTGGYPGGQAQYARVPIGETLVSPSHHLPKYVR